jgi:hypothetical protein
VKKWYVLAVVVLGATLGAQDRQPMIEWPFWGGDAGHGKYSTATDITPENVRDSEEEGDVGRGRGRAEGEARRRLRVLILPIGCGHGRTTGERRRHGDRSRNDGYLSTLRE